MTAIGSPPFVTLIRPQDRRLDIMRILGFLFLVVLLVAAVGWYRGWFAVTTVHANDGVVIHVDETQVREDGRRAATAIADTSARIAEVVKSIGRRTDANETLVDGTITAVDTIERDLTIRVDTAATGTPLLRLRVPDSLPISRNGTPVAFVELVPGARVKLTFTDAVEERRLARIELVR